MFTLCRTPGRARGAAESYKEVLFIRACSRGWGTCPAPVHWPVPSFAAKPCPRALLPGAKALEFPAPVRLGPEGGGACVGVPSYRFSVGGDEDWRAVGKRAVGIGRSRSSRTRLRLRSEAAVYMALR